MLATTLPFESKVGEILVAATDKGDYKVRLSVSWYSVPTVCVNIQ